MVIDNEHQQKESVAHGVGQLILSLLTLLALGKEEQLFGAVVQVVHLCSVSLVFLFTMFSWEKFYVCSIEKYATLQQ